MATSRRRRRKDEDKPTSGGGSVNTPRGSSSSSTSSSGSSSGGSKKKNPAGYGTKGFKPLPKAKRGNEKAVSRRQKNYSGPKDQTGSSMTRGEVRKKTATRVKAAKPELKGKKLQSRVNKQTTAGVQRRRDRGMSVPKKKKKDK